MKQRSPALYMEDIVDAMTKIERYIEEVDFAGFTQNEMIVDAVIRNLEIIGEAARNIDEDIRDNYPEIPWRRIIGLRNIVIHGYFGVDLENIWKIITENIPETQPAIRRVLDDIRQEEGNATR